MKSNSRMLLILILMISVTLAGCAVPQTTTTATTTGSPPTSTAPTSVVQLVGAWTNEPERVKKLLNEKGEPVGSIPVGDWMVFEQSGRFYRIARYMTFAIGGVMVEEGQFTSENGMIRIVNRTESFFPDQGSPQKAKFRELLADEVTLWYRLAQESGNDRLFVKTAPSESEIQFKRCLE